MTYVLDANAIVALLKNEEGADVVDNILVQAAAGTCYACMNKYNLLEVYYGFYREDGEAFADEQVRAIHESPIAIIDMLSDDVFRQAGRIKAKYKLSLADAVVLGQGLAGGAVIVTSDHHEFETVEKNEKITFLWFR
jgi:predicted nucleic acid-binding protein